ncbi:glucosaminidase domain-containing protein [bacterium]|nr:glucosaminidase domain-containing protein [bacterium]
MWRLWAGWTWLVVTCVFLLMADTLAAQYYAPAQWAWPGERLAEEADWTPEVKTVTGEPVASAGAQTADARALLVANFIERNDRAHDSPLQPYDYWGEFFVQVADEYGLDFRLLPAIARKESTFCKSNIARTYYNCFGYGVPASGITEAGKFSSFEEGIRTVAASLKRNYIDQGLTDPVSIMYKYCPPSDGSWSRNLNQWLAEMRYDDKNSGLSETGNADLTEFVATSSAK